MKLRPVTYFIFLLFLPVSVLMLCESVLSLPSAQDITPSVDKSPFSLIRSFTAHLHKTIPIEPTPAVLIGAGDISVCGLGGDDRTAQLLERLIMQFPQAAIFTAGDNAQIKGAWSEYIDCFDPTWGRFKERIHPSPGNHDWYTEQGSEYFRYFGEAAGEPGKGYYSYNLGNWHVVSLNSNCGLSCKGGPAQVQWLQTDLANNNHPCTLLYWHHPLWSSGTVPIDSIGEPFWQIASDNRAEIVVNGHDHHYERFTPLNRSGLPDQVSGMRTFIVGTGGAWLFDLGDPLAITEARDNSTLGVIVFILYQDRYDWFFVPIEGGSYTDSGSGICS